MQQTGKLDTTGEIRGLDPPHAHRTEPAYEPSVGVGVGNPMQVAAVEPEILQGAGIEGVQFLQCCGVSPSLLQPMPSELKRRPQRRQHGAGDSIEPKRGPADDGRCVCEVACRQPKRNLIHLWLAEQDLRTLCRPPFAPAQMNSFASRVKSIHACDRRGRICDVSANRSARSIPALPRAPIGGTTGWLGASPARRGRPANSRFRCRSPWCRP
jgi:hypothetical protein